MTSMTYTSAIAETTARTPNAALAYKVLDQIDADPKRWDQQLWFRMTECGTAACFAGWTCLLSGGRVKFDADGDWDSVIIDGTEHINASDAAEELLGIEDDDVPGTCEDHDDSCECKFPIPRGLFSASNTREQLGQYVEAIFGPRPDGAS